MDAKTSQRSRLRLDFSTWLLLLLPAVLLTLANIPGEYRLHWHTGEAIGCEHGWPFAWLVRQGIDGGREDLWALTRDVCYIDALGLAIDTFVAIAILSCIAAAVEWRCRRRRIWQFTLGEWMIAVAAVGLPIADATNQRRKFEKFNQELIAQSESFYGDFELELPFLVSGSFA